jgi:hypothetical protein
MERPSLGITSPSPILGRLVNAVPVTADLVRAETSAPISFVVGCPGK